MGISIGVGVVLGGELVERLFTWATNVTGPPHAVTASADLVEFCSYTRPCQKFQGVRPAGEIAGLSIVATRVVLAAWFDWRPSLSGA